VTVGGGLGASALRVLCQEGCALLILEKETQFRDRSRGIHRDLGVAEAKELGIEAALLNSCGTSDSVLSRWAWGLEPHRNDCPATGGVSFLSPGDARKPSCRRRKGPALK